ncbi:MAG: hypothetical protein ABGW99_16380 [Zunongwangia sp.]|jgi:hypothetical protein|uniref:hypothetical protein n=1 Tax=Zunongwangia sp. TaxID=1965325 RepID=UPI0032425442
MDFNQFKELGAVLSRDEQKVIYGGALEKKCPEPAGAHCETAADCCPGYGCQANPGCHDCAGNCYRL